MSPIRETAFGLGPEQGPTAGPKAEAPPVSNDDKRRADGVQYVNNAMPAVAPTYVSAAARYMIVVPAAGAPNVKL